MMVTRQSHHAPRALWHTRLRIFNCSLRVIRGGLRSGSGIGIGLDIGGVDYIILIVGTNCQANFPLPDHGTLFCSRLLRLSHASFAFSWRHAAAFPSCLLS